jgi:hypothetical protein
MVSNSKIHRTRLALSFYILVLDPFLGLLTVIDLIEVLRITSRAFGVEVGEDGYSFARGFEVERGAAVNDWFLGR